LPLSGRLPLLVALLAGSHPDDPHVIGDPSDSAVERFLRWEEVGFPPGNGHRVSCNVRQHPAVRRLMPWR
jgi:hypothetical protein